MADQLLWPPIPPLAPPRPPRRSKFVDLYAPIHAPAFVKPLEELSHENYRIITFESRYCTFCSRMFENPTALRKHISEGTTACKKAQLASSGNGPRFVFFCWKYSPGSLDPAIHPPTMHTRYALVLDLERVEHPHKDVWVSKVLPAAAPAPALQLNVQESGTQFCISVNHALQPGGAVALARSDPPTAISTVQSITAKATRTSNKARQRVALPPVTETFVPLAMMYGKILPPERQGYPTPLRRDRNFFAHFLIEERKAIKRTNPEAYNRPLYPGSRRAYDDEDDDFWDATTCPPPHISSGASPFVDPQIATRPPSPDDWSSFAAGRIRHGYDPYFPSLPLFPDSPTSSAWESTFYSYILPGTIAHPTPTYPTTFHSRYPEPPIRQPLLSDSTSTSDDDDASAGWPEPPPAVNIHPTPILRRRDPPARPATGPEVTTRPTWGDGGIMKAAKWGP